MTRKNIMNFLDNNIGRSIKKSSNGSTYTTVILNPPLGQVPNRKFQRKFKGKRNDEIQRK